MAPFRPLTAGFRRLFRKNAVERDLGDEVDHYVEMAAQEHMRDGLSCEDALRAALLEVGGVEVMKETARSGGWEAGVEAFVQDIRLAARGMRRTPGFTAIAISTLALGIGASTALFSVADEVFLKSLPVRNPEELVLFEWRSGPVWIGGTIAGMSIDAKSGEISSSAFQKLAFERFRERSQTLSDVFAFQRVSSIETTDSEPLLAQAVSGNYFQALGVATVVGRPLVMDDDRIGATPVAVLSHRYWQRRYGADPAVLNRSITLDGTAFQIVGVTPPGFAGTQELGDAPDVSLPLASAGLAGMAFKGALDIPWLWPVRVMGRVKPGVTYAQVVTDLQKEFEAAALEGWRQMPRHRANPSVPRLELTPGGKGMVEERRSLVRVMQIVSTVVAVVLLIVCTNLTNLLLARGAARGREIAVRAAIGARRGRLIRQMMTESGILALTGGAFGVLLAYWGKQLMLVWINRASPSFAVEPKLDARVLVFATAIAVITGLAVGLLPALRATRLDLALAIKNGTAQAGRSRSFLSRSLVIAQVAMSVCLLVGAGLFLHTLRNLRTTDVGFNTNNLMVFSASRPTVRSPRARANGAEPRPDPSAAWDQLVERVSGVPGVNGVTYSQYLPLDGDRAMPYLYVPGQAVAEGEDPTVYQQYVHPSYFSVLGMPLVQGRAFEARDRSTRARVAVVNEALVRQFFAGGPVLGRRVGVTKEITRPVVPDSELYEIVGVVRDSKFANVRQTAPPALFVPPWDNVQITMEVRSTVAAAPLVAAIRAAAREVTPGARVENFRTQQTVVEESFAQERQFATLTSLFGVVAMILASLGLYGLISYRVAQRTQELGVRIALGANARGVVRMVVGETLALAALGIAAGLIGAATFTRLIASALYGVPRVDPVAFGAAAFAMFLVAAIAGYVPARRAANVDPLVALRRD